MPLHPGYVRSKVYDASHAVLTQMFPHLSYDLFRPLGASEQSLPVGYQLNAAGVKEVARRILEKTEKSAPHDPIALPANYPPKSVKVVWQLNEDLAKRIEK